MRIAKSMRHLALIVLLAVAATGATRASRAQDFRSGLAAFDSGDYASAFANWWPLAKRGDPKSQASLGFLYYAGKGVRRDDRQSLLWFRRAAESGQPTAQFFLGLHYFFGRGVPRDMARAYSWCDIAMANGYSEGLFCRDAAALEMSPGDMRRSTELTTEFFRTHQFRN